MTDNLSEKIKSSMIEAMRAKDKDRLGTIRMIQAEIKQKEVDERIILDNTQIIAVLSKMKKQRLDSINQFNEAGRQDLAAKEEQELNVIAEFLPAQLTSGELEDLVKEAVAESKAESVKDMGKVMAILKPKVQGRANMSDVSDLIKSAFSS